MITWPLRSAPLTPKGFASLLTTGLLIFLVFNVAIWFLFTRDLLSEDEYVRCDLARLAYAPQSRELRKLSIDLPQRHLDFSHYNFEPVDMVTIGDSFSEGLSQGRNPYFQDYIASFNNFKVLHVTNVGHGSPLHEENFIDNAHTLLNSGFFDRIKTRYVLIESAEKHCIERFSRNIERDRRINLQELFTWIKSQQGAPLPKVGIINNGNYKLLLYNILYLFSDHAFFNNVYKCKLTHPFFSVRDSDILLFHKFDIQHIKHSTPAAVQLLNDNLNDLATALSAKGVKLVFMPCADKYDMYSDYIVDGKYPKSNFFEYLRPLPKKYIFIDTKSILGAELKKGEKDVYLADDTHWSWKASEKVFEHARFQ